MAGRRPALPPSRRRATRRRACGVADEPDERPVPRHEAAPRRLPADGATQQVRQFQLRHGVDRHDHRVAGRLPACQARPSTSARLRSAAAPGHADGRPPPAPRPAPRRHIRRQRPTADHRHPLPGKGAVQPQRRIEATRAHHPRQGPARPPAPPHPARRSPSSAARSPPARRPGIRQAQQRLRQRPARRALHETAPGRGAEADLHALLHRQHQPRPGGDDAFLHPRGFSTAASNRPPNSQGSPCRTGPGPADARRPAAPSPRPAAAARAAAMPASPAPATTTSKPPRSGKSLPARRSVVQLSMVRHEPSPVKHLLCPQPGQGLLPSGTPPRAAHPPPAHARHDDAQPSAIGPTRPVDRGRNAGRCTMAGQSGASGGGPSSAAWQRPSWRHRRSRNAPSPASAPPGR